WPAGHDFYYSSYMLLLAVLNLMGVASHYIVLLQIFSSAIAVYCFYKLILHVSKSNHIAFIGGLIYVLWFKFQQWNLILYTDSLFASLTIISVFLLVKSRR